MPKFQVHSSHETSIKVPAQTPEGHEIIGALPALIVELIPEDKWRPTITHYEVMPDDEARKRFAEGSIISISFS